MTFMTLCREAQRHSADDRIELADSLLQSLSEEELAEYERLCMEEVKRRYREFKEGKVKAIPAEQVLAELRAKLDSMPRTPEIREEIKARPFAEIRRDALQLPVDDQQELAYAIFRDLEEEGFEIDWDGPKVIGKSAILD